MSKRFTLFKTHLGSTLLLVTALLLAAPAAHAFDGEPHVLIMPGHTSSVEWDNSARAYVPTCDYITLTGSLPRRGEACDGSPRLALSVEDLRDLKYITATQDNNELVRRVYERFNDVLFVTSPDLIFDYGIHPESRTASTLTVSSPHVSDRDYESLAQIAEDRLRLDGGIWGNEFAAGVFTRPFTNTTEFDGNSLSQTRSLLPEFSLIFLPSNPSRTTLIHELLHYLIYRARAASISHFSVLQQLNLNRGKSDYIYKAVLNDLSSAKRTLGEGTVAELEAIHGQFVIEAIDMVYAEELEVAYFISLYGEELGIARDSRASEQLNFWQFADRYKKQMETLNMYVHNNIVSGDTLLAYANANAQLPARSNSVLNPLVATLPIPSFRALWAAIQGMGAAYPQNLLGSEHQINRNQPRTMLDYFVLHVGPRER